MAYRSKYILQWALLYTLLFAPLDNHAQDRDFFLIDSISFSDMSRDDSILIDSVLTLYHIAETDSDKLNLLNLIVNNCWNEHIWPRYNEFILESATKALSGKGLTPEEKQFYQRTLSGAYNNIAFEKKQKGDIMGALNYMEKSLRIDEALRDSLNIASSLNNIGVIISSQGQSDKALRHFRKSLRIYKSKKNDKGLAHSLTHIGSEYVKKNNIDSALYYFRKSLETAKRAKDRQFEGNALYSIGTIYSKQHQHDLALRYLNESEKILSESGITPGVSSCLSAISNIYLKISFDDSLNSRIAEAYLDSSEIYADHALRIGRKLGYPERITQPARILYSIYRKRGDYKKALEMHELYSTMSDSVRNIKTQRSAIEQQMRYEYEKKEALARKEQEKREALASAKSKRQRIIIVSICILLSLIITFSLFLYRRFMITKKQKRFIEEQKKVVDEKNTEITDSIRYAKRIQQAILPPGKVWHSCFPDSFVFYRPKDIVSGDFYWLRQHESETAKQSAAFAVVDCTGHGVPGAFMSLLGFNGLEDAIKEKPHGKPAEILLHLNTFIQSSVGRYEEEYHIRDGMDISVCRYKADKRELQFAGALNPIYIATRHKTQYPAELLAHENSRYALFEIKGSKVFIGDKAPQFTTHTFRTMPGDAIYMFTDGFADQFGGEKGKKYKYRRFKELLLSLQHESMAEQRDHIAREFEQWRGGLEQIDDVCVVGIRV